MATTIESAFQKLKENLEPTGLQKSTISTRQNNVREVVEKDLTVLDSFLTGSYSRSTMIAPLKDADVDVFIVLDSEYFYNYDNGQNGGQAGLLDLVKRTLRKTYTKTPDISRNGQAVTIRFEDFVVDVAPGFKIKDGGYLIPNSITQS
jgi:tRNA nucleotidyltransferase (CCA-adding enzyme)